VRGVGLIYGVELVADKQTKAPFDPKLKVGQRVLEECQKAGSSCARSRTGSPSPRR